VGRKALTKFKQKIRLVLHGKIQTTEGTSEFFEAKLSLILDHPGHSYNKTRLFWPNGFFLSIFKLISRISCTSSQSNPAL
jgi:hypothetical protein